MTDLAAPMSNHGSVEGGDARNDSAVRSRVVLDILEAPKRPVNAVADHTEAKSVVRVEIVQRPDVSARILFDAGHSWEERILNEQFRD